MKVRCVDDDISNTDDARRKGVLIKGNVYEVVEDKDTGLYKIDGCGPLWGKTRFVSVDDTAAETKRSTDLVKPVDEEAQLRKLLTAPSAGNCPCGVLRSSCEYHR